MATKIKDGLFLGDAETAADYEVLAANKVTRVVNCCGREAANAWEGVAPAGGGFGGAAGGRIEYLTYAWPEAGNVPILDDSNRVLDDLYAFLEEAAAAGEGALIHCSDGLSVSGRRGKERCGARGARAAATTAPPRLPPLRSGAPLPRPCTSCSSTAGR